MDDICKACGGSDSQLFVDNPLDREYYRVRQVEAQIRRCRTCRSLFQSPWPSRAETASFYSDTYQNYAKSKVPLLPAILLKFERWAAQRFIDRFGSAVSVLDFGCGSGGFLERLAEHGATDLAGIDFSAQPTEKRHFDLYPDIPSLVAAGRRFDVIHMHHVIEHLSDVDETMAGLRGLLKPNGRIVGQTPNAAHYTSELMGRFWGPLHYPYHTVIFTPSGLQTAAQRWGLKVSSLSSAMQPTGWSMSFDNLLKVRIFRGRKGRVPIYAGVLAFSAPFFLFDYCVNKPAIFNFELVHDETQGRASRT